MVRRAPSIWAMLYKKSIATSANLFAFKIIDDRAHVLGREDEFRLIRA